MAEPVREVAPLTSDDYLPDAATPLIDAAVKIIKATDEAVVHRGDDPNVVIVMQTDGLENVSAEYTRPDLAALIKEKKAAGWEFVYLAAGLDAFEAARASGVHVSADRVMSYSRLSSREAFAATARNLKNFAERGDADLLSYSPRQRRRAGDEYTQKHLDQGGGSTSGGEGSARRSRRKWLRGAWARVKGTGKSTVDDVDLSKRQRATSLSPGRPWLREVERGSGAWSIRGHGRAAGRWVVYP